MPWNFLLKTVTCYCCGAVWYWRGPTNYFNHHGERIWYCTPCATQQCGMMEHLGHDKECTCPCSKEQWKARKGSE